MHMADLIPRIELFFASSVLTSSNSTSSSITWSTSWTSKLWKTPIMGRCSNDATSLRVIVISLTERWKLLVSLCHLSAKAYVSPLSLVSKEHAIRRLNHVAATMTSISGASLQNFHTFLPWGQLQLRTFLKKIKKGTGWSKQSN